MATESTLIKLEPASRFTGTRFRVLRVPPAGAGSGSTGEEIATLELNRRITLSDGQVYAIVRQGGVFSSTRALWRGAEPSPGDQPLAVCRRERIGFLRWRTVLVVGPAPETRLLFRRRGRFGSVANSDVVRLVGAETGAESEGPIVLRGERVGGWRQRLQMYVLDASALSLPVVLFALNVLASQVRDEAASAAAAAGAAGAGI